MLAQELFEQGLSKSAIARRLGRDRETIRFWLRGIEEHGQKAFLDQPATACRVSRPSRQADVPLCPALNAQHGAAFLHRSMRRRFNRFVNIVQTDGGSEFEAEFAHQVWNYRTRHRIARPYKKNEQAHLPRGYPGVSTELSDRSV